MTRRKLPIGIQTFRTVREQGCYYVDKTGYAMRLADGGGRYFLSRPRRFGVIDYRVRCERQASKRRVNVEGGGR